MLTSGMGQKQKWLYRHGMTVSPSRGTSPGRPSGRMLLRWGRRIGPSGADHGSDLGDAAQAP